MAVIERGSLRYQKNWFRKERRAQESVPKNHIRKVNTGRLVSSVVGTVRATCSTGEFSSSLTTSFLDEAEEEEDELASSSSLDFTKPKKKKTRSERRKMLIT